MTHLSKNKVLVAMSGGVDSAVCAALLKEMGHEVVGITIKTWPGSKCGRGEKQKGVCCSTQDVQDAKAVASKLDIPHYVIDLSSEFKDKVVDYFVDEYLSGRTPNPCIECNRHIKFDLLLKKADSLGIYYLATGHYARKDFSQNDSLYFIQESIDKSKDQSYVLFGLEQAQLKRTLFPLGGMTKSQVRAKAKELGLAIHDKSDSQEICFVESSYVDFVKNACPSRVPGRGKFVDLNGNSLGEHEGFHLFTVGQRKRIRVTHKKPFFVKKIDAVRNEVVICHEDELGSAKMIVDRIHWTLPQVSGPLEVKIRYKTPKAPGILTILDSRKAEIIFETPQKAITPGQAAVFYKDQAVVGGGWILSAS